MQWIQPEAPVIVQREDDGVSFTLDEEYEQALGTATEEELVDLAGESASQLNKRASSSRRDAELRG